MNAPVNAPVNAPAVENEAVIVTVTSRERRNESDHGRAHDHVHNHPQDQRPGHAQPRQQQCSVIKRNNMVDNKAAQQVLTELFDTEKILFSTMLQTLYMYSYVCYSLYMYGACY